MGVQSLEAGVHTRLHGSSSRLLEKPLSEPRGSGIDHFLGKPQRLQRQLQITAVRAASNTPKSTPESRVLATQSARSDGVSFNASLAADASMIISDACVFENLGNSESNASVESSLMDEENGWVPPDESSPLLDHRKVNPGPKTEKAGLTKTFFTLLKAFIGPGIMFLPKAFSNGGVLFSSLTLLSVSLLTVVAFHLLLRCRQVYGKTDYGELGETIFGPRMREIILISLTISQLGFGCAGTVFVAQNLASFFNAISQGQLQFSTTILIASQLFVLIPLSLVRKISKLGPAALIADVLIAFGVVYICYYDVTMLASSGINQTVQLFNSGQYTLTIGATIFTFEGIGLLLPIQASMKQPDKFEGLLWIMMIILTIVFISFGALCYLAFVMASTPVVIFPALRIIETKMISHHLSGKSHRTTKWKKNAVRTAVVVLCALISIVGTSSLDKFVALVGSFACVPLVYIYPPLLHYRGVAKAGWAKMGDLVLIVLGVACMIGTTSITILNSFI